MERLHEIQPRSFLTYEVDCKYLVGEEANPYIHGDDRKISIC